MTDRLFELGPDEELGSTEAAPAGPLRRVIMVIAYDGADFRGFAPQPGLRTVGGVLARVLSRMAGTSVAARCAGRTDTGVHASGQVVHVDLPERVVDRFLKEEGAALETGTSEKAGPFELARLARSLTRQLGPSVSVERALLAPDGFDARRSAGSRRYRYEILRSAAPDPLLRFTSWHVGGELDIGAMRIGADALLGLHDFSAFCKRREGEVGPITRRVLETSWTKSEGGRLLVFEIEANAFCHRMVRSIVGTLVSVGQGLMTGATILDLLRTGDRARGRRVAPPEGLRLLYVRYPDEIVPGGVLGVMGPPGAPGLTPGTVTNLQQARGSL